MKTTAIIIYITGAALLGAADEPHIGYIYPAGGCQGTTFDVEFGGQFIEKATRLMASTEGIRAEFVDAYRDLDRRERGQWVRRMERLEETIKAETDDNKRAKMREQLAYVKHVLSLNGYDVEKKRFTARADPKKQPNAQIAERVIMRVTIAPDLPTGACEVRLAAPGGISNPLYFHIGQLPEYYETEPNEQAAHTNAALGVPCLINGQIMPGDIDRFRIKAKKGQELVFETKARHLVPYLADAVPGWFQAVLALYDSDGNELAYADDYRFDPDPVLFHEIPKDGEYIVEIRDSIYRGREDFVYRLAVGELPFITDVFPLGARCNSETVVDIDGKNLPVEWARLEIGEEPVDMCLSPARRGGLRSNPVRFASDDMPDETEMEPNDDERRSQTIGIPAAVNGRIDVPGDRDVYRFRGQAGDRLSVDVRGRRLGSPIDSVVKLTDYRGNVWAINDDTVDRGAGLTTHHADSYLQFELPKDDTYYLHIADLQHKGGPSFAYRIGVDVCRPDFGLRVVPSCVHIPAGGAAPITVHALRKNGFDGDIELRLRDAPEGMTLSGARIPAGLDVIRATLSMPWERRTEPERIDVSLEGVAAVGDRALCRRAVPAEDMMQAFLYRHLVPVDEWVVTAGRSAKALLAVDPIESGVLRIPVGGSGEVVLRALGRRPLQNVPRFELDQAPVGVSVTDTQVNKKDSSARIIIRADAETAVPGTQGNLILLALASWNKNRKIVLTTIPAIPFEIIEAEAVAKSE